MPRYDSTCNVCGGVDFSLYVLRSDDLPVIECHRCGHMVVEQFRDDPDALYGDDYFKGEDGATSGYAEYEYSAEYGSAWAGKLVQLLRQSGSVLDIGCASGYAIQQLGSGYEKSGIEINELMASEARRAGVEIIARDILEPGLPERYAGRFDIALAIAVLEHVPDFKGAVQAALKLLRPDGILLFEVPLITAKDDVWFRSSLEHIHYPTERSLQYLFSEVLGLTLVGSAVEIQDYGYVYVGLTSLSTEVSTEVGKHFRRLTSSPPNSLSDDEVHFRWLFDLIHAASATAEILSILPRLRPQDLNSLSLRRMCDLWSAHERRLEAIAAYLPEVEKARDWHAGESGKYAERVLDLENDVNLKSADILELESEATRQRRQLSDQSEELRANKAGFRALDLALDRLRDRIRDQDRDLNEYSGRIQSQELDLDKYRERIRDLEVELNDRGDRIRELEGSWSWKITGPVRSMAGLARRKSQ
jgi:SAM-dependent methyltransferase